MTTNGSVLYLHGFLSSPESAKAQLLGKWLQSKHPDIEFLCPELPNTPDKAIPYLDEYVTKLTALQGIVGSSMGGYYAHWLAQKYECKAVLINPAVNAADLLVGYLGDHINPYTQIAFELNSGHMHDLRGINVPLKPSDELLVIVETGDETLDYRLAEAKYSTANLIVEPGGNHSCQCFEKTLPAIADFLLNE